MGSGVLTRTFLAVLFTLLTFTGLDVIWIYFVVRKLYRAEIGDQLLDGFRVLPAVLLYVVIVISASFFCTIPALERGKPLLALP